jgi:3-oxoadipate enol-lactonase
LTDLAHSVDGPPGAPALVLSNSLGTTMSMWDAQLPALAERFRVVRYDLRGHGGSPDPAGELTIAELGADLLALLDDLGIGRASIAGVSLGGMTAMQVASTAPERVDRLVLCCTSARLGPREMWEQRAATVREAGTGAVAEATMGRWFTPAADPADVARFDAALREVSRDGYAAVCAAIAAPTLVIAARGDGSTPPEHGERIAAGIPGARLLVLEHGAHLCNVEHPERVTAAMLEHLTA